MTKHKHLIFKNTARLALLSVGIGVMAAGAMAANPDAPPSLRTEIANGTVRIPEPPNLAEFVRDKSAAIRLGKSLFWDMQVGSDGIQACASCHFNAGADVRVKNTLNPGSPALGAPANQTFNTGKPNYTLSAGDFPFHRKADPNNIDSTVLFDSDDVRGSQGVFLTRLVDIVPGQAEETGTLVPDTLFNVNGVNVRQVTARTTPTAINAVFNKVNFWDGRASDIFNGVSPRGGDDDNAVVYEVQPDGQVAPVRVSISEASLASQAVGPPQDVTEMSYVGRTWPMIGKKMLSLRPLARQLVHPADSVLGSLSRNPLTGLNTAYADLIRQTFQPKYWDSTTPVTIDGRTYSVMEANFSLFFGLAAQLYQATLIADRTPFDRFQEGDDTAMTVQQQEGLNVFVGQGNCLSCHTGPLFMDGAFQKVGVRPVEEDPGQSGGSFKAPGIRNVELAGPFFHTGGAGSLRQIVDLYNRGGDFRDSSDLSPLNLSEGQKDALVAFMKALTDDRVRYERAPFDHPQLFIPHGHPGDDKSVINDGTGKATDQLMELPTVGASGRPLTQPVRGFLGQ
jgi:cytochrome c peroxidase